MKKRILKLEEKELLIKDLLPRIPTGLFVDVPDEEEPKKLEKVVRWRIVYGRARSLEDCLDGLIPYLRPVSSMTKEEKEEYGKVCELDTEILANHPINGEPFPALYNSQDWLNKHYFDYRGLLEKGIALEAPAGMYNFKEK